MRRSRDAQVQARWPWTYRPGSTIVISLYNRFYRPASNLAVQVGAAALLRHVRGDGRTTRRPSRIWGRRAPAPIADACLAGLTAFLASRKGGTRRHTPPSTPTGTTDLVRLPAPGGPQALTVKAAS